MSKTTLLSIVRAQSSVGLQVGQVVTYIADSGRTYQARVATLTDTMIGLEINGEIVQVDKAKVQSGTPGLFDKLQDNQWTIKSFDGKSQMVCVEINNGKTIETVSITVPLPVSKVLT
jgi:hypothetical protein